MGNNSKRYELLVRELLQVRLSVDCPDLHVRLLHNKKYRGKSGHEHQIDVSAELELAGLSLLLLIECKHYSRKVGIDDIMEFAARIEDIGAHKGVLVTTEGFQEGGVRIARLKGIALVIARDRVWIPMLHEVTILLAPLVRGRKRVENFIRWFYQVSDTKRIPSKVINSLGCIESDFREGDYFHAPFGSYDRDQNDQQRKCCFEVATDDTSGLLLNGSGLLLLFALGLYIDR